MIIDNKNGGLSNLAFFMRHPILLDLNFWIFSVRSVLISLWRVLIFYVYGYRNRIPVVNLRVVSGSKFWMIGTLGRSFLIFHVVFIVKTTSKQHEYLYVIMVSVFDFVFFYWIKWKKKNERPETFTEYLH